MGAVWVLGEQEQKTGDLNALHLYQLDKRWFSLWGEVKPPVPVRDLVFKNLQKTNNGLIFNKINVINEDAEDGLKKEACSLFLLFKRIYFLIYTLIWLFYD